MYNYKDELTEALDTVLPTYYELFLDSDTKTPCITYLELSNMADLEGDTMRYSTLSFRIKIWGTINDDLFGYAEDLDEVMFSLGFKRTAYNELVIDTTIQHIFTYEAVALEKL